VKSSRTIRGSVGITALLCAVFGSARANADVTLAERDGWQFYTNGRFSTFLSYANGEQVPAPGPDPALPTRDLQMAPGGMQLNSDAPVSDPDSHHQSTRVRSGFMGNVLGFGLRRDLGNDTRLHAYMHLHAVIEPPDRRKWRTIETDFREAYVQFENPRWGSVWFGRSLSLFSRGATEITYLYGFQYSLGVPAAVDNIGPGVGHIGFGVLAANFAPGIVYTTPSLGGLKLAAGVFDPNSLAGQWDRTQWARPEAELTFDWETDSVLVHLFANGAWQKVYQSLSPEDETVYGVGYGGRLEVGPVHLGLAGHYGRGLGLSFALQPAEQITAGGADQDYELRVFDGYYAQLQLALGSFDLNTGAGVTRVHLLESDKYDQLDDDGDSTTSTANDDANPDALDPRGFNNYKQQLGFSGGVVYHANDYLHFSVDYFRAQMEWYLADAKQVVHFVNVGGTAQW
jgi:predicted porin